MVKWRVKERWYGKIRLPILAISLTINSMELVNLRTSFMNIMVLSKKGLKMVKVP